MQTNMLCGCKATPGFLYTTTARGSESACIRPDTVVVVNNTQLRPVELRWLAWAAEHFEQLHAVAVAAGLQQVHPLTLLPEPEAV